MTNKWSNRVVVALAVAIMAFSFPVVSRGADEQSADEPSLAPTKPSTPSESELDKRLEQIDSDIEAIIGEQDRIKEKLNRNRMEWSGSLRVTNNNFHLKDKSYLLMPAVRQIGANQYSIVIPQNDINKSYGSAWTMRLRLTMEYEITDTLRFYGQIIGFKYLNLSKTNEFLLDMEVTRYPLDAGLHIERAFFEWRPLKWLIFMAGRVSSPEGPPAELKENSIRNATWGVQMVEADMEGVGVDFLWSEANIIRLAYLPYANFADARINNDNNLFSNDGFKEFHAFAGLLEMKLPLLGDNVFQLGTVLVPKFGPRNNAIFVYPDTNEALFPEKDLVYAIDPETGKSLKATNLGLYANLNTLVELKNIAGTGLDLFAAYTLTFLKPTNQKMMYNIKKFQKFNLKPDGTLQDTGETVPIEETGLTPGTPGTVIPIGLASANDDPIAYVDDPNNPGHPVYPYMWSTKLSFAHFVYVGFRYSPTEHIWSFFKNYPFRIGFEFNMGTRYHFTWSSPSDLLINKYGVRGKVYEVYVIQQLVTNHLFIRIGYMFVQRDYDGVYLGPARKVNQEIQNAYAVLDASW